MSRANAVEIGEVHAEGKAGPELFAAARSRAQGDLAETTSSLHCYPRLIDSAGNIPEINKRPTLIDRAQSR